ncbi:MAG: hypothetical protein HXX17_08755 [Geobacteraceae bacterium]|nr:hypothetical protein [Geobacteraceae bacterium]
MFKLHKRSEVMVLLMLLASLTLYGIDYFVFGNEREIGFSFIGNLAFLPIYVLFVTFMIERILKQREKDVLRQKMNMVIGVFFSEVGTPFLKDGFCFLMDKEGLADRVKITAQWSDAEFTGLSHFLDKGDMRMDSRLCSMDDLKAFFVSKRNFMLGLLENPNLLEHDGFTELLWAVFHLLEELQYRQSLVGLPDADMDHLSGDIRRAYTHLLKQWVVYLQHLKSDYPYLYSLAVRHNPLNPEARVVLS